MDTWGDDRAGVLLIHLIEAQVARTLPRGPSYEKLWVQAQALTSLFLEEYIRSGSRAYASEPRRLDRVGHVLVTRLSSLSPVLQRGLQEVAASAHEAGERHSGMSDPAAAAAQRSPLEVSSEGGVAWVCTQAETLVQVIVDTLWPPNSPDQVSKQELAERGKSRGKGWV